MESYDRNCYNQLTDSVRNSLDTLIDKNTLCLRLRSFTILLDIVALVFLIYGFINFYTHPYNLLYCILSAALISYFGIIIMKVPNENSKKESEGFKALLLFNICECEKHCDCRKRLNEYLNERRVKL